jgi:hypothetical protein
MTKSKLIWLLLPLFLLMLPTTGCQYWDNMTNSGSGSSSASGSGSATNSTSQAEQPHGPVTVNLMERTPFKGRDLDPAFWSKMEAYCKAGPTQLVLADLHQVPNQMTRAGFYGEWKAQCYALATTYAGGSWTPVAETEGLWHQRGEITAWWSRYVGAVVQLMQKAPQTTAIIITNDGPDRVGFRLGPATHRNMGPVQGRVQVGKTVDESEY